MQAKEKPTRATFGVFGGTAFACIAPFRAPTEPMLQMREPREQRRNQPQTPFERWFPLCLRSAFAGAKGDAIANQGAMQATAKPTTDPVWAKPPPPDNTGKPLPLPIQASPLQTNSYKLLTRPNISISCKPPLWQPMTQNRQTPNNGFWWVPPLRQRCSKTKPRKRKHSKI